MKTPFLLILSILSSFVLTVQSQTSNLFTTKKELSSSMVNQVYPDSKGFVWIATESGLSKYDGSKFVTYKHNRKDSTSLLDNYVKTLFESKKGELYIGTLKGLQRYNYDTEDFTYIPIINDRGKRINAHIQNIIELQDQRLLVSTSGLSILFFHPNQDTIYVKDNRYNLPAITNAAVEMPDKTLWLATESNGIIQITPNGEAITHRSAQGNPISSVTCLCLDYANNLYAGTNDNGLLIYDKKINEFIPIKDPILSERPIKALRMISSNELFIGSDGKGLRVYNTEEKKLSQIVPLSSAIDLQNSKVHSIALDHYDNLWLGIFQKGVLFLSHKANNFTYWGHNSPFFNNIGSNCIMAIYQDKEGVIWVGTDNDGIYKLSADGKQLAHFTNNFNHNSVPSTILCLYEDSEGTLWVGSYMQGMAKMNKRTGECHYVELTDTEGNPAKRIYSITEDSNKRLWIGTMGQGLFNMDIHTGKTVPFPATESTREELLHQGTLPNYWINQLYFNKIENRIYMGTYGGLNCLDLNKMEFIAPLGTDISTSSNIVNSIFVDKNQNCWFGTSDGLYYFNKAARQLKEYTTENGLPSNYIAAIQKARNGNLWISTNQGIAQYDLNTQKFISYTNELQNTEYIRGNTFMNQKGEIFMGGTMGITKFIPEEITIPQALPDIRITGFYIHNKRVKRGMKSGRYDIIDCSVYDAKDFHLSSKDNSFTIEFSMSDFSKPEIYSYSMNNGPWTTLQPGTNQISFSELNPGIYTFSIKAQNHSIESDIDQIIIHIHPAWYASGWAITMYYIIGFVILILIFYQIHHHYKQRQEIMEHVHAEEINEAKLQFFINISHEIRTPLSLIISPLKELMTTDNDQNHQKKYHLINRNAQRILHLINQLMDVRKIEKGQMRLIFRETDILGFTKDLTETLQYQAESKQISLKVISELKELNVWIDPEYFDKILMNLLWNALKYTPQGGEINVYINKAKSADYAEMIVEDSGPGIDESEMEKIFQRFYQTKQQNRASGTGIGLHLTQQLVSLHHGSISVENNEGHAGCKFIVRLPLGNAHLQNDETTTEKIEPITQKETILSAIANESSIERPTERTRSKTKYTVLIAEDEEEVQNYLDTELSAYFNIITCSNGKEALETVLKTQVNLVVSDVMMPEMDGLTLCQKLKHNINTNDIPIVLLTAKTRDEDKLSGLHSGADAYLTKPFNLEILRSTIENLIRNREVLKNNYSGKQTQEDKLVPIAVSGKSPDEKLMERVMKIMNENISNPELNVEMIAEQVGISRVHLYRKLKELTNQSTRDFIRNTRLKQAAILLTEKNKNVSEAALLVGFNNINYFSSVFKEVYGVPPTTYVERYKQQKASEETKTEE